MVIRSALRLGLAGAALAAIYAGAAPAQADTGLTVSPGMEIHQAGNLCTLGFVDPVARIAYSAGHCGGAGPVTDKDGHFIGMVTNSRDNTPNGTVVRTDQVISDYETIALAAEVTPSSVLPDGRQLVVDPTVALVQGAPVCHFGVVTGESCGAIERVNNGWFTMFNGVVSKKGDSGGPVYAPAGDGKAAIVGLFNSTWGDLPAAVSWQATGQQVREDTAVINVASSSQNG
jgi:hypothetical protein